MATGFIYKFNTIFLFSNYIAFCLWNNTELTGYGSKKIMGIFVDLRDVMGGNISKI
jgi:hypothetical protein